MKPYAESFSTWVIERCLGCGSSSFWRYNDKKTDTRTISLLWMFCRKGLGTVHSSCYGLYWRAWGWAAVHTTNLSHPQRPKNKSGRTGVLFTRLILARVHLGANQWPLVPGAARDTLHPLHCATERPQDYHSNNRMDSFELPNINLTADQTIGKFVN